MLADGETLPAGFESLQVSTQPETRYSQIDGVYKDPSTGIVVRYTTARGPMSDVALSERTHDVYPIDVCIRDAKGRSLIGPTYFGDRPYIKGCGQRTPRPKALERGYGAAVRGLELLETARFRPEYEPEHQSLVGTLRAENVDVEELLEGGTIVKETRNGGRVIFLDDPASPDGAR